MNETNLTGFKAFRREIYLTIDNEQNSTWRSQIFDAVIMILILMSLVSTIAESFESVKTQYDWYFDQFEMITLVIFATEYFLRLWTADFMYPNEETRKAATWKFFTSGTGMVDLLAILPLFVPLLFNLDMRFIRILKITRMLRILKLSNFTASIIVVGDVFYEKRYELGVTLFTTFVVLLVASTAMYYIEHDAPDNITNGKFVNIIDTMWWAVATLTTVGYGDIYPITGWGKLMGGIIAVLGLGVIALPTGIIGAAYIEKIENQREADRIAREEAARSENPTENINIEELVIENSTISNTNDLVESIRQHVHQHPQASTDHQFCFNKFGTEFIYCPYCGKNMKEDGGHTHS